MVPGEKNRIPKPIDQGKHCESGIYYLWDNYKKFNRLIRSGDEPLLTVESDRYVCGLPLPSFQRTFCWSEAQQVAFIESAWLGLHLGTFTHHHIDWEIDGTPKPFSGWVIDGQQRLTSVQNYLEDKFKIFNLYFSELNKIERSRFMRIKFAHYEAKLSNELQIRNLYNRLAFGGTAHKAHEKA
ncbi:DUF262 domain-containing protein [Microbulbifer epialgicus]|uniref:DUF262 domain-containing protein n=1 Tax=Microbulbifer epialgicus TaxID=393907 RepID=A0ABV4NUZ2_9GAMM